MDNKGDSNTTASYIHHLAVQIVVQSDRLVFFAGAMRVASGCNYGWLSSHYGPNSLIWFSSHKRKRALFIPGLLPPGFYLGKHVSMLKFLISFCFIISKKVIR